MLPGSGGGAGGSPLSTVTTTRRRTVDSIDFAEEDGTGSGGGVGGGGHQVHHLSPVGCCTMLRRRMNSLLRFLRPGRNLNSWILRAFMLLLVSTMFFKLMLMSRFLEFNAKMNRHDFLVRPVLINHSEVEQNLVEGKDDVIVKPMVRFSL